MPAPPVQPIVIWFGRVGDLILLSALLEVLHRRFGSPCHVNRGRFLAGADLRCAQRCGARFVPASLHGMGV